MKNFTATALIALTIACATFGQTSADFKSKYRQVISYEISPGVIATPNYTTDGQVCRIVVEKRMADNGRIIFGSSFSNAEVKEIVDELVPANKRGRNLTARLNTTVDGGFVETDRSYQHVLVREFGITRPVARPVVVIAIICRGRTCAPTER